jgi:hypothetical protein
MPLKKLLLKSGVNRENTRYTTEGGWYTSDKIRFRQGTPESIGGWQRISSSTFIGICRSLWNWVTLGFLNLMGVGTNLKFYIEKGGVYNDVTPLRTTNTLNNPFATNGTNIVTVTDASGGFKVGDFVTFSNATVVDGLNLNGNFQILTIPTATTYTFDAGAVASGTTASGGGSAVYAAYEIGVGSAISLPQTGWGGGGWGLGSWGNGAITDRAIRLWSVNNYGEDLVYGPRGGGIYYWNASIGVIPVQVTITIAAPGVLTSTAFFSNGEALSLTTTGSLPTGLTPGTTYYVVNASGTTFNLATTPGGTAITTSGTQSGTHSISPRGINISNLAGASNTPVIQNNILVTDASRFVMCFGVNPLGETYIDPMLIRWSDQENVAMWTPSATNQAGDLRLSTGSEIVTELQSRQEILVWTDSALYGLQYLGPPVVWGSQILGDNISIVGPNAKAIASGVVYWMGVDKFYKYDGRVNTLRCDLRRYVFNDINLAQADQIFAGTNEGFNEVWWFYCSANSTVIDKYVIYNYLEDIWYYGFMSRTAWIDSGLRDFPVAAGYQHNLINHETGVDDNETGVSLPINAYIESAEFDLDDGHNFSFVWRVLPDITFRGSTATSPTATMYLYPLANSGSGYINTDPGDPENHSVAQKSYANVVRTATLPVEKFTGQLYTRVRGRQLAMRIESNQLGTAWQLGSPRVDIRKDGRR